jgi:hypothetical protein
VLHTLIESLIIFAFPPWRYSKKPWRVDETKRALPAAIHICVLVPKSVRWRSKMPCLKVSKSVISLIPVRVQTVRRMKILPWRLHWRNASDFVRILRFHDFRLGPNATSTAGRNQVIRFTRFVETRI